MRGILSRSFELGSCGNRLRKAEARLWRPLRDRRLGGFRFRRQHPVGNFIADFFCDEAKLAIEIDGGGHGFRQQAAYDAERTAELGKRGVRVLRFWNDQVVGKESLDEVLKMILGALRETPPSP